MNRILTLKCAFLLVSFQIPFEIEELISFWIQ